MEQFIVGPDGLLSEAAAIEQAAWYQSQSPDVDPVNFEAHFMLMRGFEALKAEPPFFEKRGGVSSARFSILRFLYAAPENRMVMSDIVQNMNVSPTNITKLVDGLERSNYVRRAGNSADKRQVWVELLPEGRRLVESLMPGVVDYIHGLWAGLTAEEKRLLIHLIAKLRLNILTGSVAEQLRVAPANAQIGQSGA